MLKEGAVSGDFSRSDTLADLSAAVGLSGTEKKRLQSVIGTVIRGSDARSNPVTEALLRNDPRDDENGEGRVRTQDSSAHPEHRRAPHTPRTESRPGPMPHPLAPSTLPTGLHLVRPLPASASADCTASGVSLAG